MKECLFIVDTVDDGKYILKNHKREIQNSVITTTKTPVNSYLKNAGIHCISLSEMIEDDEVLILEEQADVFINEFLTKLDIELSPLILAEFDIKPMKVFEPNFNLFTSGFHLGLLKYEKSISRLLDKFNFDKVILVRNNSIQINEKKLVPYITKKLCKKYSCKFSIINIKTSLLYEGYYDKFKRVLYLLRKFNIKGKSIHKKLDQKIIPKKKYIIILGSLYNIKHLINSLEEEYNIIFWRSEEDLKIDLPPKNVVNSERLNEILQNYTNLEPIEEIYFTIFNKQILKYIRHISIMKYLINENMIECLMWGNSPFTGIDGFIVEYLMNCGIPVIGFQHGSHYGIANVNRQHLHSDFMKCSTFFSYGFTKKDYFETYKNVEPLCEIIPTGMPKKHYSKVDINLSNADILYLPTNNISIFYDTVRMKNCEQSILQSKIIYLLNGLKNINITVKPFMFSTTKNCSFKRDINKCKQIKLINHLNTTDLLNQSHFRLIILDVMSTTLYESLEYDSEIFVLEDKYRIWNPDALKQLQKRVHFFDDIISLGVLLKKWRNNTLEIKRDNSFLQKHVYADDFEKTSLKYIKKIIKKNKDKVL
jgi:hypothetical protein